VLSSKALLGVVMAFAITMVVLPQASSAREMRMTVAAANKRAFAICTADQQAIAKQSARLNDGRITAGQSVWHYRASAAATRRIDRSLSGLRVTVSYRKKLDAFIAANSKLIAVDDQIVAYFAAMPTGRHVSSPDLGRWSNRWQKVSSPALLIAADDDVPTLCVVGG
jgi:hypothetical protein